MLFKKLFSSVHTSTQTAAPAPVDYPLEIEAKLTNIHGRAPVRRHLDILYADLSIGSEPFTDLYFRCLADTGTVVTPFNVLQRFQTRHDLVRYFLATLTVPGARVECGAYRGATALLLCHGWRSVDPAFTGAGLYLVDSFTGTTESTSRDYIPVRQPDGSAGMQAFFPAGKSDVTPEMVRGFFGEFPQVEIRSGWVPAVFETLGESAFAFVHIDLTLYEATLAALEYFHPRLSEGGVILCDGSIFCPGVEQAVARYAADRGVVFVTLGHRQYVFMKSAPDAPA